MPHPHTASASPALIGSWLRVTLLLTLVGSLAMAPMARAQVEVRNAQETEDGIGEVRKAPTEIVLLRDKNGNLVKVATNLSLEEYLRIYNQQSDVEDDNAPPAFVIDQAVYTGQASATHLSFTVQFRVQLIQAVQEEWVKVPLRLPQCVMRAAPNYTGDGEFFVTWDAQLGHVAWMRGDINSQHMISLHLTRPLRQAGQVTELVLQPPVARSQFRQLVVPVKQAQAAAGELEVRVSNVSGTATSFAFDFQSDELIFGWSAEDAVFSQPLSRIQASVETSFAVHQNRSISARGVLTVTGLGAEVTDFEVLLPTGMTLLDIPSPTFRATRLPATEERIEQQRERVRISIVRPQSNVTIPLEAESKPENEDNANGNQTFNGFEVVDAVKQSGSISVSTTTNWDVVWQLSGDIRRTPRTFDSAAGSQGLQQFDFEYYNVAYTVVGVLQERENQFLVVPAYLLEVSPTQLRMTATLRCLYSGSGQYQLSGNWDGWDLDQVFQSVEGTLQLVNAELTDGTLGFQISTADTDSRGEFEVSIRARKQLPAETEDDRPLDLLIPRLDVTSTMNASILKGTRTVILQPANNVKLMPDMENMVGLLAGSVNDVSDETLPEYQQTPLVFHSQPNLDAEEVLRFVGTIGTRKRSVLVASRTAVQLEEKYASFEQVLDYQIAYEPIRQITLTVPGVVRRPENLRIFLQPADASGEDGSGNVILPWSVVPSSAQVDQERTQLEIEQVTVDLLAEYNGALRIVLRYQEQLPLLMADTSQRVNFLLVSPSSEEVRLVQNEVTLNTQDIFVSEPADDVWQVVRGVTSEDTGADSLRLRASEGVTSLPVEMRMRRDITRTSTLIQRRWIQTALLNGQCRERMAMFVRTNEADLHVKFREGTIDPATLIVAVNNQRVPVDQVVLDSQGQLTVRLAASGIESDYRIELWYMRADFDDKRLDLELPQVVDSGLSGSTYWQLVTTNDQHLLGSPQGWTPEYDWIWSGLFWFRSSVLEQSDLEAWVGVANQLKLPENTNQYLLSTVGEVTTLNASVTSRSTLLLFLSGMVLLVGLAILRLRFMQQPIVIFGVGLVAALVAVWFPEWMLLVIQASFLGGLLVVLSRILNWLLAGPGWSSRPIHRSSLHTDTNSAAISLLKLDSSIAAANSPPIVDDSEQQQAST